MRFTEVTDGSKEKWKTEKLRTAKSITVIPNIRTTPITSDTA
jgi:hypothetical protein